MKTAIATATCPVSVDRTYPQRLAEAWAKANNKQATYKRMAESLLRLSR